MSTMDKVIRKTVNELQDELIGKEVRRQLKLRTQMIKEAIEAYLDSPGGKKTLSANVRRYMSRSFTDDDMDPFYYLPAKEYKALLRRAVRSILK